MVTPGFYVAVIASVFAIVDPIGTLPFYLALTEGFDPADRRIIMHQAVVVLGVVLGVFALVGRYLFAAFGFTLYSFEVAGGILLFLVAYDMLHGEIARTKLSPADRAEAIQRRDEISIVPLGIPLLAGPGAISTVMIYAGTQSVDPYALLCTLIAIAVTTVVCYFVFRYGERILRYIGKVGIMAVTRVLGLLLAAVGVQFVLNGVLGVFHGM